MDPAPSLTSADESLIDAASKDARERLEKLLASGKCSAIGKGLALIAALKADQASDNDQIFFVRGDCDSDLVEPPYLCCIDRLLQEPDICLDIKDLIGWPALMWAVKKDKYAAPLFGATSILLQILEKGADLFFVDPHGYQPITVASEKCLDTLITYALSHAEHKERLVSICLDQLLLIPLNKLVTIFPRVAHKALIELVKKNNEEHLKVMLALLKDTGMITKKDDEGWTVLMYAAYLNCPALVTVILNTEAGKQEVSEINSEKSADTLLIGGLFESGDYGLPPQHNALSVAATPEIANLIKEAQTRGNAVVCVTSPPITPIFQRSRNSHATGPDADPRTTAPCKINSGEAHLKCHG